jgi:hypothetical protein
MQFAEKLVTNFGKEQPRLRFLTLPTEMAQGAVEGKWLLTSTLIIRWIIGSRCAHKNSRTAIVCRWQFAPSERTESTKT